MRRTAGLLVTGLLLLAAALTGCGSDIPAGVLTEDDLPDGVSVSKITHDVSANQVECQDVNDAEDDNVVSIASNYNTDDEAAVSYRLKGSGKEYLGSSVWMLANPEAELAKVSKGLDACVKSHPEIYARFDVEGYPDGIGYTAKEGNPTPVFTRRILVPLKDRVVIVSITRQGDDTFSVKPDDLLEKAVKASAEVSK